MIAKSVTRFVKRIGYSIKFETRKGNIQLKQKRPKYMEAAMLYRGEGMARLPPEVLTIILGQTLGYIGRISENSVYICSIYTCMLVSRLWYTIARELAYRHFVVRGKLNCPEHHDLLYNRMESISILIDDTCGQAVLTNLSRCLQNLRKLLQRSTSLRSFSFKISDISRPTQYRIALNPAALACVIGALPASCTDLEIDTLGIERGAKSRIRPTSDDLAHDPSHLCEAVQAVLPRLKHVRLRVAYLCPAVFGLVVDGSLKSHALRPKRNPTLPSGGLYPFLETLSIVCTHDSVIPGRCTECCGIGGRLNEHSPYAIPNDWIPSYLVRPVREMYLRGNFPKAQVIQVIDYCAGQHHGNDICDTYHIRDIIAGNTKLMPAPWREVTSTADNGEKKFRIYRELRYPNKKAVAYLDKSLGDRNESIRSETGVRVAENSGWGSSLYGVRLWENQFWNEARHQLTSLEQIDCGNDDNNAVWEWERLAKVELLRGHTLDDLTDICVLGVEHHSTSTQSSKRIIRGNSDDSPSFPEPFDKDDQIFDWPMPSGNICIYPLSTEL